MATPVPHLKWSGRWDSSLNPPDAVALGGVPLFHLQLMQAAKSLPILSTEDENPQNEPICCARPALPVFRATRGVPIEQSMSGPQGA